MAIKRPMENWKKCFKELEREAVKRKRGEKDLVKREERQRMLMNEFRRE